MDATNKGALSKLVKAWEAKNDQRVKRAAGLGLMAVSLAACGGSDDTPYSQAEVDALEAAVATAVAAKTTADAARVAAEAAEEAAESALAAANEALLDSQTDAAAAETARQIAVAAAEQAAALAEDALADAAEAAAALETATKALDASEAAEAAAVASLNAANAQLVVSQNATAAAQTAAQLAAQAQAAAETAQAALQATLTDMQADITAAGFGSLDALIAAYQALLNPTVFTTAIDSLPGTTGNDTFSAVITATSNTLTNLDSAIGGAGTDTLQISDVSNTAFALPTVMTLTGIENIVLNHLSAAATDTIAMDVSGYADVDSITIVNAGTAIGQAGGLNDGVVVTASSNVQTVSISGGATAQAIVDATINDNGVGVADVLATVSLTGLTGNAGIASDVLTTLNINAVRGLVTNTDSAATDARALTVNVGGGTNGGVTDAGATTATVNVTAATTNAGTHTYDAATTLNVNVNGALTDLPRDFSSICD